MMRGGAGVLDNADQEAVIMQCGYADELFQAWRDGKMRRNLGDP